MRRAASPPAPLQDRSSRMLSFMVLDRIIDLKELDGTPQPEWETIYCSSKKAYGCGVYGQKLVEGLALYVRRDYPADPTSSLAIRLSDEALRNIRAEIGCPSGRLQGHGQVSNVCQQLLTIYMNLSTYTGSKRTYCLVFDSTDASLCMTPFIPKPFEACYRRSAVPFRGASEEDHQLAVMAYKTQNRYLCVCTPETRANSASDHSSPWKVTEEMPFPEISSPFFMLDVMFSIHKKVFWGDLTRGVVYCDLGAADGAVKFNFINLPKAYRIYWDVCSDDPVELPVISRTMGCDGDSIKFICIDSSKPGRGNEMVKILTLDLDRGCWKESKGVLWKELWKKVNFMQAKLGDVVPQYPTLMSDGTLCLLCKNTRQRLEEPDFICCFDMCSKSLLSAGPVVKHLNFMSRGYLVTPYNFFTMCNPPPLRKRKLPSHARELPELPSHARELPALKKKKLPTHKRRPQTILKTTPKSSSWAAQQGRN